MCDTFVTRAPTPLSGQHGRSLRRRSRVPQADAAVRARLRKPPSEGWIQGCRGVDSGLQGGGFRATEGGFRATEGGFRATKGGFRAAG
eukprot:1179329-Prorocentrum_minimum.AAC.2